MKSVLAEYYAPLYDNYHIFALDTGFGESIMNKDILIEKTKYWIQDNLAVNNNQLILCNLALKDLKVTGFNTLFSSEGSTFWNQAVSYQKYRDIGLIAEQILEFLGLLEETEHVEEITSQQIEVEEKLVKIDESLQELMQLIDGVQFSDGKIKKTITNKISTAGSFTKRLLTEEPTKTSTGVNHTDLFHSLQSKYINVMDEIDKLIHAASSYVSSTSKINDLNDDYNILLSELRQLEEEYENAKLSEVKSDITKAKNAIASKEKEMKQVSKQISSNESNKYSMKNTYLSLKKTLEEVNSSCYEKCNEVLTHLTDIKNLQQNAKTEVEIFKSNVNNLKGKISDDLLHEFESETKRMEGYISYDSSSLCVNLSDVEKIIEKQKKLLTKIQTIEIPKLPQNSYEENSFLAKLNSIKSVYSSYPSGKPVFDYASLNINNKTESDFFETLENLMKSGVMSLVLDENSISKATISGDSLPSDWYGSIKEPQTAIQKLLNLLNNSAVGELLSLSGISNIKSAIMNDVKEILDKIIFISYVEDHFTNYLSEEFNGILNYEMEYFIGANSKDSDNLSTVIMKIFLLRFSMNFLYLLSNASCRNQAMVAATSAVGFTGFAALVSIVKYLILSVWAMEGALVEVSSIMQGKRISFFVTNNTLSVSFSELLTMTKQVIKNKASDLKDSKIGLKYQDYLRLFLFCKPKDILSFHSMDLIQENIRLVYDDNFYIKNCINSYTVEANYQLPVKFLFLPVVRNKFSFDTDGYSYQIKKEIAY